MLVSLTESIPDLSWKTEKPCGELYLRRLKGGGKSHQIISFFKQTVYNEVGKKEKLEIPSPPHGDRAFDGTSP
nr:hypothetical protein CFP56_50748 [Quercus suber]